MTQGSIYISAPDESFDLRALADWLRMDGEFRGRIRLIEEPIRSEHMGGMVEAIAISVGGGGVANTLVRCFFTWLGKQGERHRAHLTLKDDAGREASLEVNGLRDSDALVLKTFEFFTQDE